MTKQRVFSEWFWSKASAEACAARLRTMGFEARARYAMAADGDNGWLAEAFA